MVRLNRIYTRTGDDGTTGLVGGERRLKCAARVAAVGAVDETNAAIGLARLHCGGESGLDAILARIQNDLFDLGADLATPPQDGESEEKALRIVAAETARLEAEIDGLNADLAPLKSFVLPGGTTAAAHLHFARTVCRRAERDAVALAVDSAETVNPEALRYLNRLSDLLFVASRWANGRGAADVLWVPGGNR